MNKIQVEDITNQEQNIKIEKDTWLFIKNSNCKLNITITNNSNIFTYISSSKLNIKVNTKNNLILNIFSINSSLDAIINLNQDNLKLDYAYSTINEIDNNYKIIVNHLGNNITSNIVSHGFNLKSKLNFTVNAVVPDSSIGVETSQDSKIILEDGEAQIKPNLLVDIDDVIANHSAYIGEFKNEDLFYLATRGLDKNSCKKLLAKSFLIGPMKITFREKNVILEILKKYWRW